MLGIVNDDDESVGFIHPAIPLDAAFIQRAGTSPLRRFRFAEPCATSNCSQWRGDRCGVIDDVLAATSSQPLDAPLPYCSIRKTCRWFSQSGRAACGSCRFVVTETSVPVTAAGRKSVSAAAVLPGHLLQVAPTGRPAREEGASD